MSQPNVVVLQSDAEIEHLLVSALNGLSEQVHAARCMAQVREQVMQGQSRIAVLDMEAVSIVEIEQFVRDFPFVTLVCNHRLADDDVWKTAMNAGAEDCCASRDTRSILRAIGFSTSRALQAAA